MTDTITQSSITLKIFIGVTITSELKMHLNQSITWKHVKMHTTTSEVNLEEVHYHGKDFIGFYLQTDPLILELLRAESRLLRNKLAECCPAMDFDHLPICIFPQLFVA